MAVPGGPAVQRVVVPAVFDLERFVETFGRVFLRGLEGGAR